MEIDKLQAFLTDCEARFGVKTGLCQNDAKLYHASLRKSCKANACGGYGRCHTCPPNIGTAEECIQRALTYNTILVFQKVYPLEDSYDFYGMMEAQKEFHRVVHSVAESARVVLPDPFILGAGGCSHCESCAALENKPCRFPEKALASLEGYCINVSELAAGSGLAYINGADTVTYFGGIFLNGNAV